MNDDPSVVTVEQFERALRGDRVAARDLVIEGREAVFLASQLREFYRSERQRRVANTSLRFAAAAAATVLVAASLGSLVLAQGDLRSILWLAPQPSRVEGSGGRVDNTRPRTMSHDEALAAAPFRAIRPPFVPGDYRPAGATLLVPTQGLSVLMLRFEAPRGWLTIEQTPRSAGGMDVRVSVAEGAATEVEIDGARGILVRGAWRSDGSARVWDPAAPGRSLIVATDELIIQVNWGGDSISVVEATRIASAVLSASRR